jgi:hypothetical protein
LGVVGIAGTAIYFATKRKSTESTDDFAKDFEPDDAAEPVRSSSSGFPLSKGSRGDLVRNIQEALIAKFGATILPKYGADGIWGTELQNALIAKGFPTTVDAATFSSIIGTTEVATTDTTSVSTTTTTKKKFNPDLLATNLRVAVLDDDFERSIELLKKIWTVSGYTKVNDIFKEKRIGGVRKTIVNALLTQFSEAAQKKKLNEQFYRIGLKYNGSQWSLSGLDQILCDQIMSLKESPVWNREGKSIKVPEATILGMFLDAKNGVTKFRTLDDKVLFIHTNCICYV